MKIDGAEQLLSVCIIRSLLSVHNLLLRCFSATKLLIILPNYLSDFRASEID